MKSVVSILLTAAMLFALMPFYAISAPAEGYTDAQGVTYTLSDDGTYYTVSDFDQRPSVTEVIIPSEIDSIPITTIGDYAFSWCSDLTRITIPHSVTTIGVEAFYYCSGLTSITIPDSVTTIGDYAFNRCFGLTSITIPDSVTTMGYSAFGGCSGLLTSITVEEENPVYHSTGNCIIETETNTLIQGCKNSIIPDYVIAIDDYAFSYCYDLLNITIPDSVRYIGERAFEGCSSLTSVTISENVRAVGEYIFDESYSLTDIYCKVDTQPKGWDENWQYGCGATVHWEGRISSGEGLAETYTDAQGVTYSLGYETGYVYYVNDFDDSAEEVVISNEVNGVPVTWISEYAFYESHALKSIVIPDNVSSISFSAFANCPNLSNITVPDTISIAEDAFGNCPSLTKTLYENAYYYGNESNPYQIFYEVADETASSFVLHSDTKTIVSNAFAGCYNLTSIKIPDGIRVFGGNAFGYDVFGGCTELENVYIESLSSWCGIVFSSYYSNPLCYAENLYVNDTLITDLVVPDEVTKVNDLAFYGFDGLMSVYMHDGVEYIGHNAFENCSNLTDLTIGSSMADFERSAFFGCNALTNITVSEENPVFHSDNNCIIESYTSTLVLGCINCVIPDYVTSIGDSAFAYYDGLTDITLGDNIISICESAFLDCRNLQSVVLGKNLVDIDTCAFENCVSLTSIVLPDSLDSIGDRAFSGCTSLEEVFFGKGIRGIGNTAFEDCRNLTKVVLPMKLQHIGYRSFGGCEKLQSVIFPRNDFIYTSSRSFEGCTGLNTLYVPINVDFINTAVFDNCSNLTDIYCEAESQPENWDENWLGNCNATVHWGYNGYTLGEDGYELDKYIGGETNVKIPFENDGIPVIIVKIFAFAGNEDITSVILPDSIKRIEPYAFSGCTALEKINIPDGISAIDYGTFAGCSSLSEITLPDTIKTIGDDAFNGSGLTEITIPASVSTVGSNAFYDCNNLTDIYCEAEAMPDGWYSDWLYGCDATVHWGYVNDEPEIKLGDVDGDGEVGQFDYLVVKRAFFNTYTLTDDQQQAADVNNDGAVDQFDYLCIKRAYFGTYTIQ